MGSYINDRGYNSETKGARRSDFTRDQLLGNILYSIDSQLIEEKAKKRKLERLEIQGNGKFISAGSNDRVNGSDYKGNDIQLYPTKEDRLSYHYGYTVHGGRRLMYVIEQLENQEKYEEIALIAERDYNNGLKEEELGMVANIPAYLEAYRKIANRNKRK